MKRRSKLPLARCLVLLVPLRLLDSGTASADEPEKSRAGREVVTVTTSLLTPFFGAYEMEAKVRASNAFGVVLNASYLSLEKDDWRTKTGTVGAGVNYFFQRDALRRWYVEAIGELMFSSWRHEPSGQVAPIILGYSGIAGVGYLFVCDRGPVLDLGAGIVALHFPRALVAAGDGSVSSKAFTSVYPGVKINVGWAF